jgi:carbon storage regulator
MLVLSRKKDGVVRIGDDIQVYVIEIRGDKVRLGFTAPPGVSIHREEIYNKIKESNAEDCSLAIAIAGVISRAKEGGV